MQSLPKEIVNLLFNEFNYYDLQRCQRVCREWYSPLHMKYLNKVELRSHLAIEKFIASIDQNPKISYLNAVKTIHIDFPYSSPADYRLEQTSIEKLFSQFPNLENVEIRIHTETCKQLTVQHGYMHLHIIDLS